MADHIPTGGVNHLTLTVTDVARSVEWYKDLGPGLGIYVLAFRDPDNVQLELTAPYSG